jgi:hypothetical protein
VAVAARPAQGVELYPGSGSRPDGTPKLPSLTEEGRRKYLAREGSTCGPALVVHRIKKVSEAMHQPEVKLQVGAMEDAAAALIAHAAHLRDVHNIPAKPIKK